MKVKNGYFRKIRIAFLWIFKFSDGIGVNCNYCGSLELDFIEKKQGENSYISKYRCKRCGATATNIEM
ncbi:MAG: hypothetical protein LIR50_05910 [Bacillota bacterium]|nr:hypothetical protein [Bacillota bacterium]